MRYLIEHSSERFDSKMFKFKTKLGIFSFLKGANLPLTQNTGSTDSFGDFRKDLPMYTTDEIERHTTKATGMWITYKKGVYDITNYTHHGGELIRLAAGSSIEPFWLFYPTHYNKEVMTAMEKMRIGNVAEEITNFHEIPDPFVHEPCRHLQLKTVIEKPFNAETSMEILLDDFYTPNASFFVRNHLAIPHLDPVTYELQVRMGNGSKQFTLSLADIKSLPKCTISATLMCAGNRRSEMSEVKPIRHLNWGKGAVGNAKWTGCYLRDILSMLNEEFNNFMHVHFEGYDLDLIRKSFGASIPLPRAMDERSDVLVAYEMNGEPIPHDHGFPVRVIVPGFAGARSVKWLRRITVSKYESFAHWQRKDYRIFSPNVNWNNVDFNQGLAIEEMPVTSAICKPQPGETVVVVDGCIEVRGYAYSGGGQVIVRVDVTVDQGETWHTANLDQQERSEPFRHWTWTLWSVIIPVGKLDKVEIWVKAVDFACNTQPESFKNIWNLCGVACNAYNRVPVLLKRNQ